MLSHAIHNNYWPHTSLSHVMQDITCAVLQCVAVCGSVLQRVAVRGSLQLLLQCAAVCCSVLQRVAVRGSLQLLLQCAAACCSVLQRVAVRGSLQLLLQYSKRYRMGRILLQCVAEYCCSTPTEVSNFDCCALWDTGWRRVIGCLIFIRHFPQKSPIISG